MGTIRDVDEPKIEIPAGPGFSIKSQMRNRFIDINLEDTLWTSKSGKIIRLLLNIARGLESKLQPGERELLHDLVQENGGSLAITSYSSPQMKDNINQIS